MHALNRLRQLHLIADQNDIGGSAGHGDQVAKRNLSCFIDEQVIIFFALVFPAKMKRRAANKPVLGRSILGVHNRRDRGILSRVCRRCLSSHR